MALDFCPQFDARREAAEEEARDPNALRKEALKKRKQKQLGIVGQRKPEQRGGIIGAINSQIDFNAELLGFKALWLMGIDLLLLIFNIPYLQMQNEFKLAEESGIAYKPDQNGVWPKIYKTDERGELDYDQPYECLPEEVPIVEIFENGYVPGATPWRGFAAGLADMKRDLSGEGALSREELMLLNRCALESGSVKSEEGNDVRRRQEDAARAAAQRPVPRPAAGH